MSESIEINTLEAMIGVINNSLVTPVDNLTGYWTGVTAAISSSMKILAESAAETASRNEEVGRKMTDLAADYAKGLQNAADGMDSIAQRQMM